MKKATWIVIFLFLAGGLKGDRLLFSRNADKNGDSAHYLIKGDRLLFFGHGEPIKNVESPHYLLAEKGDKSLFYCHWKPMQGMKDGSNPYYLYYCEPVRKDEDNPYYLCHCERLQGAWQSHNLKRKNLPDPFYVQGASLMANNSKDSKVTLKDLLPLEINGWKAKGKDKLYDPQTIFDYINGAGEVYRSYNFKLLLARRFSRENQPDIVADLFEMESSRDAFGVFTHDLEGDDAEMGQGSTYKGGLLSFWKDRFFVSLYSEEETDEAKKALYALGKRVASTIEKEGETPDIVSFLPPEDLAEKGIHYFHNHMILNYHFYVSDENILLLDQKTEAALGAYGGKDERCYLLLVRYPEERKASKAYESFTKAYMPDAREPGLIQTEDLKWTAASVKGDLLFIVFNAPSDSYAREIIEKAEKKAKNK